METLPLYHFHFHLAGKGTPRWKNIYYPFFSVWQSNISRRHDSHDRYDGYLGIPPLLSSLTGEHPANANAGVGFSSPSSARKPTPAVRKIKRFCRLRLQGVTHYTLPCKAVCQTFPLDSLMAGLTPCAILRPTLRMEGRYLYPCRQWQHDGASQNCRHTCHGCHALHQYTL